MNGEKDKRFRVYKTKMLVEFFGVLADSTTFEPLDNIVENGNICDMRNLSFASWTGIENLNRYFKEKNIKVTLTNLSQSNFSTFKLVAFSHDIYDIISFNIHIYNKNTKKIESIFYKRSVLKEKFNDNEFASDSGALIIQPRKFLIQDYFYLKDDFKFTVDWVSRDADEIGFIYSYLLFSYTTLDLSCNILESMRLNLIDLLEKTNLVLMSGDQALNNLNQDNKSDNSEKFKIILSKINQEIQNCLTSLEKDTSNLLPCIKDITAELLSESNITNFYNKVFIYLDSLNKFNMIGNSFEDVGYNIGLELQKIKYIDELKNVLDSIDSLTEDQLTEIRDNFSIMDILSEDSWDDTKDEIISQVSAAEDNMLKCTTTILGFDLIRQIFQHRIKEMELIVESKDALIEKAISWKTLKENLIKKVLKHNVTEQEKRCFIFYLENWNIEEKENEDNNQKPGEILLF